MKRGDVLVDAFPAEGTGHERPWVEYRQVWAPLKLFFLISFVHRLNAPAIDPSCVYYVIKLCGPFTLA